jgi:hypothetical protein
MTLIYYYKSVLEVGPGMPLVLALVRLTITFAKVMLRAQARVRDVAMCDAIAPLVIQPASSAPKDDKVLHKPLPRSRPPTLGPWAMRLILALRDTQVFGLVLDHRA